MKPVLKYVALLIVSGLIIPLYYYTGAVQTAPVITAAKADMIDNPVKRGGYDQFSVIHHVAAKLLPALNFLNKAVTYLVLFAS